MYSDERILSSDRLARTREWFSVGGQPNGLVVLSLLDHIDALAERLAAVMVERDNAQAIARGALASVDHLTAECERLRNERADADAMVLAYERGDRPPWRSESGFNPEEA
jgi:hypothetical protein